MRLRTILNELERTDWSAERKDRSGLVRNGNEVLDYFGDNMDIKSIDYRQCLGFVQHLSAKGMKGPTINRKLSALSKMFRVAQRHDRKVMKPELPYQKEGKPRSRVLSDAEAKALVTYDWPFPEHRDLTILLMDTGCRPSEITEGDWSVKGDELTLRDTKNGDDRTVILTPEAQAAAQRLAGRRVNYSTYGQHFRKATKAMGMDDVVVYTLRHSALTRLAERVDNPLLIQKWAGHRNLATTQRYVKATRKGMEKLAEALRRS